MVGNTVQNQASYAFKVIPSNTINIPQPYVRASGTNSAILATNLVDVGAEFVGGALPVSVGDTVYNDTNNTIATVTVVVSDSQLTLSANIFAATPEDYTIYQGNAAPNEFLLYVGTTGDISIQTSAEKAVILTNIGNASFIPIGVGRVNTLGTTASDIVALI